MKGVENLPMEGGPVSLASSAGGVEGGRGRRGSQGLLQLTSQFPALPLPLASTRSIKHTEILKLKMKEAAARPDCQEIHCGEGLKIVVGHVSQRNVNPEDPDSKPNQDAFVVESNLDGTGATSLFAVFDGHGKDGHHCAQYARAHFGDAVRMSAHFPSDMPKAFSSACKQVNLEMHREPTVPDVRSGTTCIAVSTIGRSLTAANVGDSRAILATMEGDKLTAVDLSEDQTPFREDERERVMDCGAEILTLDELEGSVELMHPSEWEASDPPRLWVPCTGYPGTAFTRSIGDSLAEGGIHPCGCYSTCFCQSRWFGSCLS